MSSKILRVFIDSYGGLTDMELDFPQEKQIVAVIADGDRGKSTLMNFITACTTGIVPDDAISRLTGKAKGSMDLQVDEPDGSKQTYTIEISKTKKSETVKVKTNGMMGGKEALRKIMGPVAVKPFELKKMKPADQIIEFKKLCRIDTTEVDKKIKEKTKERTMVGRANRDLQGWILSHNENSIDIEQKAVRLKDPIELQPLLDKQTKAVQHNQSIKDAQTHIDNLNKDNDRLEEEKQDIINQIEALQIKLNAVTERQVNLVKAINLETQEFKKLVPIELETIVAEIEAANKHNEDRTNFEEFRIKLADQQKKQDEYDQLTNDIATLKEEKEDIIKNSQIKVPGLEFKEPVEDERGEMLSDEEGLYFEGNPISSLSTTKLVQMSVLIKNAIDTANGFKGLPVLIVDDFESVGSEGREEIERLCREQNYQAIVAYMDPNISDLKVVIKDNLQFTPQQNEEAPAIYTKKHTPKKTDSAQKENSDQAAVQTEGS